MATSEIPAVLVPAVDAIARTYGRTLGWLLAGTEKILGRRAKPLGPSRVLGMLVGVHAGVLFVWTGPGAIAVAVVVGVLVAGVANRRIAYRRLTGAERTELTAIFADRAQGVDDGWLDRVVLTDLAGRAGRAFTLPGGDGYIYCNLGERLDRLDAAGGRRLLVHELTHALQINRIGSHADFLGDAIGLQMRFDRGENVYGLTGTSGVAWESLNLEQQATAMEQRVR